MMLECCSKGMHLPLDGFVTHSSTTALYIWNIYMISQLL